MRKFIENWQKSKNLKWLISYHKKEYCSWMDTSNFTKLGIEVESSCIKFADTHKKEIGRLLIKLENL